VRTLRAAPEEDDLSAPERALTLGRPKRRRPLRNEQHLLVRVMQVVGQTGFPGGHS
jgi:hypothetical protein